MYSFIVTWLCGEEQRSGSSDLQASRISEHICISTVMLGHSLHVVGIVIISSSFCNESFRIRSGRQLHLVQCSEDFGNMLGASCRWKSRKGNHVQLFRPQLAASAQLFAPI